MRSRIALTVVLCICFSLILVLGFVHRLSKPRVLSDNELRQLGGVILQTPRRFSDFKLIDQRGRPFPRERFEGRWTLIFFGYTQCPDICPTTLATLDRLMDVIDESERQKLQVVFLSLDPERDTPPKLADYLAYFNEEFIGLTGSAFQVESLATQLGVVFSKSAAKNSPYQIDHSTNLVLLNPRGDYHGFFRPPLDESSLQAALTSLMHSFEG